LSKKSPFEYVVHDSIIESEFAKEFKQNENIKVYAKLPGWFKIDTALGTYNPDWAILFEKDNEEKLYYVVENKGTLEKEFLRPAEKGKIDFGIKHFEELSRATGQDIRMIVARDIEDVVDQVV
jgi:type III restriction enzyme